MSKLRVQLTKELLDKEHVPVELKSQALASVIYETTKTHKFMGAVLQSLTINYSHIVPTASVLFNPDAKRWEMLINPYFFCKKLTTISERRAILLHELSHILHKHAHRIPFLKLSPRRRQLMNIAADMAINQYIKDMPRGCPQCPPIEMQQQGQKCRNELCPGRFIFVEDYYDINPSNCARIPWPTHQTMEFYYEKLLTKFNESNNPNSDGINGSDLPDTVNDHLWDNSGVDEKDVLDATEELAKRALVKSRMDYSEIPTVARELLEEIKVRRAELNYKQLIMLAMKRHAAGHDRAHTWTRPSKRYGNYAPGTKVGELPRLRIYIDTSGSISIEEANAFLDVVDQFLRVGSRKCDLGFFHTRLYKMDRYKLGNQVAREEIENGGTCMAPVMADIFKAKADLSIVLTDGYWENVDYESWLKPGEQFPQTLWIISKDGTAEHPLHRLGETVKIPDSATFKK